MPNICPVHPAILSILSGLQRVDFSVDPACEPSRGTRTI